MYAVAFGILWVLADKRRTIGFDVLYVIGFLGVVLLAIIQHGAGGRVAPYHELYMFLLIGAALMHPPRRVFGFLPPSLPRCSRRPSTRRATPWRARSPPSSSYGRGCRSC